MFFANNTNQTAYITRQLDLFGNEDQYHYLMHIPWIYYHIHSQKHLSPATHILTTHTAYRDLCTVHHPTINPHRCAIVHSMSHPYYDYDTFEHERKPWINTFQLPFDKKFVYWSLDGPIENHMMIKMGLGLVGWLILGFGGYMYFSRW